MSQRIYAAPLLEPGRVVVMHDGVVVAMGTISNLACIGAALSAPNADIYAAGSIGQRNTLIL
jgi:hypothetical protein